MRKVYLILILIACFFTAQAQRVLLPREPDFSKPKTVAADASASLDRAMRDGNDGAALRALINMTIALSNVDSDSVPQAIERINYFRGRAKTPSGRSLATILLATLYSDIAQGPASVTQRIVAGDPRALAVALADSALMDADALKDAKIGDYATIIECDRNSAVFYPTLYDFVATRAIDIYRDCYPVNTRPMPAAMLTLYPECASQPTEYLSDTARRIIETYNSLIAFHEGHAAPMINYQYERLRYVYSEVAQSADTQETGRLYSAALKQLFNDSRRSEYSSLVLENFPEADNEQWLYDHCRDNLAKFPAYFNNNALHNIINALEHKNLRIEIPRYVLPGVPFEVKVSSSNVNCAVLRLCRVNAAWDDVVKLSNIDMNAVSTDTVEMAGTVPFDAEATASLTAPDCGRYVVIADFDGRAPLHDYSTLHTIDCIDMLLGSTGYDTRRFVVVDAVTGAPVKGATLYDVDNQTAVATTDGDGMAAPSLKGAANLVAKKSGSLSNSDRVYYDRQNHDGDTREITNIETFTSQALYRPGDTLHWAAVVFKTSYKGSRPVGGEKMQVQLFDANYQMVADTTVTSDEFGRAAGTFVIPAGRLTGRWLLGVSASGNTVHSAVTVSDYKLPTFEIRDARAVVGLPADSSVTIKGIVKTYSGFALADASVSVNVTCSRFNPRWWWWRGQNVDFYASGSLTTDASGAFSLDLPSELMKLAPFADGFFTATITATSPAGESHEATACFTLHPRPAICAGDVTALDVSAPVTLPVQVVDAEGATVDAPVQYALRRNGDIVRRGTVQAPNPKVDWKDLPGGTYDILLTTAGATDTTYINNVCIYRPTDHYSPSNDVLWTPANALSVEGAKAQLLVGTSAQQTHVLMTVWTDDDYCVRKWVKLGRGLNNVEVKLPDDSTVCHVTLYAACRLRTSQLDVTVTPRPAVRKLRLEATSMRDRLTPGAEETWTFRVTDRDGRPVRAAMVVDTYNAALDALAPHSISLRVPSIQRRRFSANLFSGVSSVSSAFMSPTARSLVEQTINTPDWRTWGNSLYEYYFSRGNGLYFATSAARPTMRSAKASAPDDGDMALEESASDYADGVAEAEEEEAEGTESDYRPSEVALALWRPMLTTDADGNLSISFTVPNANTAWQMRALAYSDDMLVADMSRVLVANKPVMVQGNLPRFLRAGDTSRIASLVMNNSDSAQTITTVVTLFNPATSKVIDTRTFTDTFAAGESRTYYIDAATDASMTMLGFRVKATAGSFTDGEQTAIPVLDEVQPVIETTTFYSAPSQQVIEVPVNAKDAQLTLEFTENPLWTVVTALPGLQKRDPRTSVEAAMSIYSAVTASNIIKQNPDIATALRRWSESDRSDSTLVSMLERNSELKTLLLQATPWMVDAMTDTERMQRLALLFDSREIKAALDAGVNVLAQTVCTDGGWAWSLADPDRSRASEWATMHVLITLGELDTDLAAIDKRLPDLAERALKYMDARVAEQYSKYPSADYMGYTFMRLMYPSVRQSTASAKASNATVQRIIGGWKRYNSLDKAFAAIILERSKYHTTALQLIESLREYAISSPTAGMTWKVPTAQYGSVWATAVILRAFAIVQPGCADIDPIRQWLILQKQAMNWGNSFATALACDAILRSGAAPSRLARQARVYVDGHELDVTGETFFGYLKTRFTGSSVKIVKGGDTPAYGAVYAVSNQRMAEVKAASCRDLSVEKTLEVLRGTEWVPIDTLRVGDRVRTVLTIAANREIDYLAVTDLRAACLEPVDQLPTSVYSQGVCFYREMLDTETRLFLRRLPKGTYRLTYEFFVTAAGTYTSGIATAQSQYAPALTAHSSASPLHIPQ